MEEYIAVEAYFDASSEPVILGMLRHLFAETASSNIPELERILHDDLRSYIEPA